MTVKLLENNKHLQITYSDNNNVVYKPVAWRYLDDVLVLQKQIFELFLEEDGLMSVFKGSNRKLWSHIETLANLVPSIDKACGGIKLELIDDIEDIVKIFINSEPSYGIDGSLDQLQYPSYISIMNGLNFRPIQEEVISHYLEKKKKLNQDTEKSDNP